MSHHTAQLMAAFSHGGNLYVLPVIAALGFAAWRLGRAKAQLKAQGGVSALHPVPVAHRATSTLTVILAIGFLYSAFHPGCAVLKAHSAICLSNVKRLSGGVLQYSQDYDEKLPPAGRWEDAAMKRLPEPTYADDAARDPRVCPAATTPASYGMNSALAGVELGAVEAPAGTVLLFEADATAGQFVGGIGDVAARRHEGMSFLGFADGHAKGVRASGLRELGWTKKGRAHGDPAPTRPDPHSLATRSASPPARPSPGCCRRTPRRRSRSSTGSPAP